MIDLSSEFRELASKIYTFSFLCLSVKLLKVTSISQAGVKISIENTGLLAGAFAVVVLFLTISASLKLLSDFVRTRVSDEVAHEEISGLKPSDLQPATNRLPTFTETNFGFIRATATVSFVIEALVPLIIGFGISWYARHDVVAVLQEITK